MKAYTPMNTLNTPNREQWLNSLTTHLRQHFTTSGFTIPENVRMTCGFPSKSATSRKNRRIGECWDASRSDGKVFEIFISPVVSDAVEVGAILAHELVHSTVGLKAGHKGQFIKCAKAIGLEGKMTSTHPGEAFKQALGVMVADVGPYPHETLNASSAPKKQGTRMVKCECEECGYVVRTTSKWIETEGAPHCANPEHPAMIVS